MKKHINKCKIAGCTDSLYAKQYCRKHYLKYSFNFGEYQKNRRTNGKSGTKCTVETCTTGIYAKGLCFRHYWRMKNNGNIDNPVYINKDQKCSVCELPAKVRGYCRKHYNNFRSTGDALKNTAFNQHIELFGEPLSSIARKLGVSKQYVHNIVYSNTTIKSSSIDKIKYINSKLYEYIVKNRSIKYVKHKK